MRDHPVPDDDSATGGLPSQQDGFEDDTEGHRTMADGAPGYRVDEQPGIKADAATYRVQDDADDVEGHVRAAGAQPGIKADAATYRVQDDADDVEGHSKV